MTDEEREQWKAEVALLRAAVAEAEERGYNAGWSDEREHTKAWIRREIDKAAPLARREPAVQLQVATATGMLHTIEAGEHIGPSCPACRRAMEHVGGDFLCRCGHTSSGGHSV